MSGRRRPADGAPNPLRRLRRCESGATGIEYALIGTLIAIAIIGGLTAVGTQMNTMWSGLGTTMTAPS